MGEELKKPEEEKKEAHEAPKAAAEEVIKKEDKNKSKAAPAAEEQTPPPPQEIVLKVFMHCEGCARKVRRCLKGFPGVEEVITECKTSKVIVKGEKAEALKVLERVQRKSHRQVQLISPNPPPPPPPEKKDEVIKAADDIIKQQEEEIIPVITVVLGVYMHCEACAQEIKKRILRMKGVESAEPDLKCSQVTVKGKIEPEKLTDYIHKRTGKQAVIIKVEPEKKEDEKEKPKEEKEKGEKEAKKDEEIAKEGGDVAASGGDGGGAAIEPPPKPEEEAVEEPKMELELKRNEFYYYYPQNHQVDYPQRFVQENYAYAPQMFSDENPNACTVM